MTDKTLALYNQENVFMLYAQQFQWKYALINICYIYASYFLK